LGRGPEGGTIKKGRGGSVGRKKKRKKEYLSQSLGGGGSGERKKGRPTEGSAWDGDESPEGL